MYVTCEHAASNMSWNLSSPSIRRSFTEAPPDVSTCTVCLSTTVNACITQQAAGEGYSAPCPGSGPGASGCQCNREATATVTACAMFSTATQHAGLLQPRTPVQAVAQVSESLKRTAGVQAEALCSILA